MQRFFNGTGALILFVLTSALSVNAQTVEFTSVDVTGDVMTLTADNGYQLVLEHSDSGKFNNDGRVEMNAASNVTFRAIGFEISQINFENIDDMDDSGPRDTWIASVPGKWQDNTDLTVAKKSDGLEIFTLDAGVPVSWSVDERQRLRDVNGVGDIIINTSGGKNPEGEAAIFRPAPSVSEFTIYMDDIDDGRGATMFFTIAGVSVEVQDTTAPELTGPSGFPDEQITNVPFFKTVSDAHTGEVLTVAANEPIKTFSLLGDDAEHLTISDQGLIEFEQAPQFDSPDDLDGDNAYKAQVEAVDLAGNTTTLPITITVSEDGTVTTNSADPVISAPNADSVDPFEYSISEYETLEVEQFTADEPVTWSIVGTDAADFSIDSAGNLSFDSLPSHANPIDDDTNNIYDLEVIGADVDGNETRKTVIINVTPKSPQLTGPDGPDKLTTGKTFRQEFFEENYVLDDGAIVKEEKNYKDTTTYYPKSRFVPQVNGSTNNSGANYAGKITSDVPISSWNVNAGRDRSKFNITDNGLVFFDHDGGDSTDPADYENPNDSNQDNVYEVEFSGVAENGEIVYADFSVKIKDYIEGALPGSEALPPTANDDFKNDIKVGDEAVVNVLQNDVPKTLDAASVLLLDDTGSEETSYDVDGEGKWSVVEVVNAKREIINVEITFKPNDTPDDEFTGDPTPVQYVVSDGLGRQSDPATVTLDYKNAPVAEDDTSAGNSTDQPVVVDVLNNDAAGTGGLDPSSVKLIDDENEVTTLPVTDEGEWNVESDGTIKFTIDPVFNGDPSPVDYVVSDDAGSKSNPATVTVGYGATPVAADDLSTDNPIGLPVVVDVLNNDAAETGSLDPNSVRLIDGGNEETTLTVNGEGVWSVESDGTIKFTPEDGFGGDPSPVDYVVSDDAAQSNQAELKIEYSDPPVAVDDEKLNQTVGSSVTFDVLDNDTVGDRALDVSIVKLLDESNSNAEVSQLTIPGEGEWKVDDQTGLVTFTPLENFLGPVTPAQYVVYDTQGNVSNPANIALAYNTANQYRDSDGDGIPDHLDPNPAEYDPQGYFYCEDDGRIIPGGGIEVKNEKTSLTNSSVGVSNGIRIVRDGSDGEFQWFALEEGTFTVTYTPPAGFDINTSENEGTLDVTTLLSSNNFTDGVAFIGSEEDGDSGVLKDFRPSANAYYEEFKIAKGDPHVLGNNIALKDCAITHAIEVVQDGAENNDGDPTSVKFTVSVENPPSNDQAISYTLSGGAEAGVDFADQNSGIVRIAAGKTSVEITLDVLEDGLVEEAESVNVTLTRFVEDGTITSLDSSLTAGATISDDDATEIVVRDVDLSATEVSDDHGSMAFSLAGKPMDDVILTFSGDANCEVSPEVITLTPQNYSSEQTLDIIAIKDGKNEGKHSCQPTVNVSSDDGRFAGLNLSLSAVQIVDSMIDQIYEPLQQILENDLRETVAKQSRLFGDIAKGARDRLADQLGTQCEAMLNRTLADRPIVFETGRTDPVDDRTAILSELSDVLQRCGSDKVEVLGFADASGSNADNINLSQARAQAVVEALVHLGVDNERLVARGYGASKPVADNSTAEGRAQNRRVEFRVINAGVQPEHCGQVRPFDVDGFAEAGAERAFTDGTFGEEFYNCQTGVRHITRGEFSVSHDDQGTQAFLSATGQRERLVEDDHLRGYFVGGYLSRTTIDTLADGEIDGYGLNAGLYGAKRLDQQIIWDYYLAGAVGHHEFDLRFSQGLPLAIDADGSYQYYALFGGLSVSGEAQYGETLVTPRAGLDLTYASATDADVTASMPGRIEKSKISLQDQKGMRIFGELGFTIGEEQLDDDTRKLIERLHLAPRLYCDMAIGSDNATACGIGAGLEYRVTDPRNGTSWGFDVDAESTEDTSRSSIGLFYEKAFWQDHGSVVVGSDVSAAGDPNVSADLTVEW